MPVVPFIPVIASVIGAGAAVYSANRSGQAAERVAASNAQAAASTAQQASATPVSKPTVMPVANGVAVQDAKRKSITDQLANRGRASTILTDPTNDKLGG